MQKEINKEVSHFFSELRKNKLKKMTTEQKSALGKKMANARWLKATSLERKAFCEMMRSKKQKYVKKIEGESQALSK